MGKTRGSHLVQVNRKNEQHTREIQKQIFSLRTTQESYNHRGHRPPSLIFDWKLNLVDGTLLL
jgi:hypothetical protein